jgi:putative transposase
MCRQRGRKKRYRDEIEKATRPDERWGTDLMYVTIDGVNYYYLAFIDEYSRYIVHWELLSNMEGHSVSVGGQKALETLPRTEQGELLARPEIRSDNGSGFISQEFHGVLAHYGLTHVKIRPHCPEENGIMERSNRTVREALEEEEPASRYEAEAALGRIIHWYNHERLHSSLGYLRPIDYYRGDPQSLHEARRRKLGAARHRRRERTWSYDNQPCPLKDDQPVANFRPRNVSLPVKQINLATRLPSDRIAANSQPTVQSRPKRPVGQASGLPEGMQPSLQAGGE